MAIGSAPEIGVEFTTFGSLAPHLHDLWYEHIRIGFGPDMMKGYAYLDYPRPDRICPPIPAGSTLRIGIIPESDNSSRTMG